MLKIYDALKSVLFTVFATFSFVTYTFFILALSSTAANLGPTSKLLHLILLYSVLQGICTLIHRWKAAPAVRRMVHFTLSLASFLLVFVAWGGYTTGAAKVLAMAGAFILTYTLIAAALAIIHAVVDRKKNKTLEYELFAKESKESKK